ncbi:MAG: hypothetical protein ACTHVE_10860 [Senegalia sp. (in: firmicutes)]|uniref:hypothetical protein n=1 Tax=Senegalia sp. (in: firmicutes) TaxID=1924098 RepID=UPI003F9E9B7E
MEKFPIIHTNFWDATMAVPIVLVLTQTIKILLPIKSVYIPSIANLIGLFISIFFAHKNNLSAGIFMGLFYGNAAVGVYSSLKTSWIAYKKKHKK